MIKTILVPVSGTRTDDSVFETALLMAQPLAAHLQFYHLRLSPAEAALHAPHAEYARGLAVADALNFLGEREEALAEAAADHVERFCSRHKLQRLAVPERRDAVSANWLQEDGDPAERLLFRTRHSDLVVLGRRQHADYLPSGLIEELLIKSGRPIVIAPAEAPSRITGTIVVGWKETAEAARAVAASLPLLEQARRVILVGIAEADGTGRALRDLSRQLAWHGISAEPHEVAGKFGPAKNRLLSVAKSLKADMLVVGGFGHGPLRELVMGGVTRTLLDEADMPVFMAH